jgi:hypothetical protein
MNGRGSSVETWAHETSGGSRCKVQWRDNIWTVFLSCLQVRTRLQAWYPGCGCIDALRPASKVFGFRPRPWKRTGRHGQPKEVGLAGSDTDNRKTRHPSPACRKAWHPARGGSNLPAGILPRQPDPAVSAKSSCSMQHSSYSDPSDPSIHRSRVAIRWCEIRMRSVGGNCRECVKCRVHFFEASPLPEEPWLGMTRGQI